MSKSYQGKEVVEFKQTPGKVYCLNPAFERNLPDGKNKKVLDVGCGDGFYYNMCAQKGYEYRGIDISEDMVHKAQSNFPNGKFRTGSCLDLTKMYKNDSFDVVITSMLFPEFETIEIFKKTLREMYSVLKEGGVLLLGSAHPTFDMYMRKYLLNSENVEADFYSYFDSGKVFKVKSLTMGVVFEDHHWTFEDYINGITETGFKISGIDECKIIDRAKDEVSFYNDRIKLPSYILFKAEKGTR